MSWTLSIQNLQTLRRPNRRRLTGLLAGGIFSSSCGDVYKAVVTPRRGLRLPLRLPMPLRLPALRAVLRFPVARLQPPFHHDGTALVEILPAALGLLAPHHHGEEAHLVALLTTLRRVVAIHGQAKIRHGRAARCISKLRGARQVPHQEHFVEARRHQTLSSTVAG